jgi:hypothetical protein
MANIKIWKKAILIAQLITDAKTFSYISNKSSAGAVQYASDDKFT